MSKLATLQATATNLNSRLNKAIALVAELTPKAEAAAAAALAYSKIALTEGAIEAGLPNGTEVVFSYGRAETKRELTGLVVGSKPQDKGATLYRVESGEGFDKEIYKLFGAQIISHNYAPTSDEPESQVAEESGELVDALSAAELAALNA